MVELTLPRTEKTAWHTLHTNTWGDEDEPRLAPEAEAEAEAEAKAGCGGACGSEWGVCNDG